MWENCLILNPCQSTKLANRWTKNQGGFNPVHLSSWYLKSYVTIQAPTLSQWFCLFNSLRYSNQKRNNENSPLRFRVNYTVIINWLNIHYTEWAHKEYLCLKIFEWKIKSTTPYTKQSIAFPLFLLHHHVWQLTQN